MKPASQYRQIPLLDRDRHALNIAYEIAQYSEASPAALPALAYSTGYNLSYLEKLAASFRDHGVLKSIRGSRGGYVLARSPDKISVAEILSAAGKMSLSEATSRKRHEASPYSGQVDVLFTQIKQFRFALLAHITLADILEDRAAAHPFLQDVLAR